MIKVLVYILFFAPSLLFAQHPILKSIQFLEDPKGMRIDLVIEAGNTCNGIRVFHSVQPESGFNQAGIIPGICGDSENDSRHSFVHEKPVDFDSNYYYFEFGGQGASEIVSVFYVPNSVNTTVVRVAEGSIILYPSNENNSISSVALYDLNGALIGFGRETGNQYIIDIETVNNVSFYLLEMIFNDGRKDVRKIGLLP